MSLTFSFSGCWVNSAFTVQQSTAGLAFGFFNKKAGFSFSCHVASTENYKYMSKHKRFCVQRFLPICLYPFLLISKSIF